MLFKTEMAKVPENLLEDKNSIVNTMVAEVLATQGIVLVTLEYSGFIIINFTHYANTD